MTSHGFPSLFFPASHPSDEELLACLDGELDGRSLARVRRHLDGCWPCRARRDRFDRSITAFVEMRLADGAGRTGFPPASTALFTARLREVDARAEADGARSRWRRWLSPRVLLRRAMLRARAVGARVTPARLAPLTVALLTIAVIVVSIGREPRVSAQELLVRTAAAQDARLRPLAQPVIYQRLQVSRRPAAPPARVAAPADAAEQTWEVWSDATHGRYRERVGAFAPIAPRGGAGTDTQPCLAGAAATADASAVGAAAGSRAGAAAGAAEASEPAPVRELEAILCANGLPTTRLLSAAVYREWRGRVRDASDQIQSGALDDGREAMVLRTSVADADPLRIQQAELVVRTEDWHPLVQRFVVEPRAGAGPIAYELRELSFEVVPLASVTPGFFEDAPREPSRVEAPAPLAPPVSEADLIAAHVQALSALHRLGALLGEPIEVVRGSSRRIEVRGLASNATRKQEIAEAVSGIPLVTVDVHTIDEAISAHRHRPNAPPAAAEAEPDTTTVQTGTLPIQPLLDAYLAAAAAGAPASAAPGSSAANVTTAAKPQGRGAAFATEVVSVSREAMTHAWALERLARFTLALDRSSVRPSTRRTLDAVALDLANGLTQQLERLDQRVTPVVAPLLGDANAGTAAAGASNGEAKDAAPGVGAPAAGPTQPATGASFTMPADDWPRQALRAFERVRAADEATRRLFTESDSAALDLADASRTLLASCRDGRRLAQGLASTLGANAGGDAAAPAQAR